MKPKVNNYITELEHLIFQVSYLQAQSYVHMCILQIFTIHRFHYVGRQTIIEQKYIKCLENGLKMCFRDMHTVKYVSSFHFIEYPEQDTDNCVYLIKEQFSTQQQMNSHSTTYCICTIRVNTAEIKQT